MSSKPDNRRRLRYTPPRNNPTPYGWVYIPLPQHQHSQRVMRGNKARSNFVYPPLPMTYNQAHYTDTTCKDSRPADPSWGAQYPAGSFSPSGTYGWIIDTGATDHVHANSDIRSRAPRTRKKKTGRSRADPGPHHNLGYLEATLLLRVGADTDGNQIK